MIDLSVIIVNYNVKHFLEHCINSVQSALKELHAEIIVVDNASVDGSVAHIKKIFPSVKIIANNENLGFSKANNIGIRQSKGEFVLLLNPDTVVQEKTLSTHLDYLRKNQNVGALGTKMLDGGGQFLPESKRGFPNPRAALFRLLGLNYIFPKSKFFNSYHLGHLDPDQIHEVDVLSGAYFFIRKEVLADIGLLDETFFMYGEDIDLSYRIKKAGYKVIYHPGHPIIHYKGESTKKGSFNYVRHFYQAMIIFAKKHFRKERAGLLITILKIGVFVRAGLSLINRFFHQFGPLVIFAGIVFMGLNVFAKFWANFRFHDPDYYNDAPLLINFLLYSAVWTSVVFFSGLFTKHSKLIVFARNIIIGTLILLAIYGLLDTEFRSSRAILLFGAVASFITGLIAQYIWNFINGGVWRFSRKLTKRSVIVGSIEECQRVINIIHRSEAQLDVLGFVSPSNSKAHEDFLTHTANLSALAKIEQLDEIVFCLKDIDIHEVMQLMSKIGGAIEYKIIGDESLSIVGSKSKNSPGEWYSVDIKFNLNARRSRINKRFFDILISCLLLILSPILVIFQKQRRNLFYNIKEVLFGMKTWVSYYQKDSLYDELPELKAGVMHPLSGKDVEYMNSSVIRRANLLYAKEYDWNKDLEILWRGIRYLGGE